MTGSGLKRTVVPVWSVSPTTVMACVVSPRENFI